MRTLVFGGAGSGKSLYAEELARACAGDGSLYYLATMECSDDESCARVLRHRCQRAGKGFITWEIPRPQPIDCLPGGGVVLLEDLGNLCANTLFGPMPPADAGKELDHFLLRLERQCQDLVVVSNDLFRDGSCYEGETQRYLNLLAWLHRRLTSRFDTVTEIVCGLPIMWKGNRK